MDDGFDTLKEYSLVIFASTILFPIISGLILWNIDVILIGVSINILAALIALVMWTVSLYSNEKSLRYYDFLLINLIFVGILYLVIMYGGFSPLVNAFVFFILSLCGFYLIGEYIYSFEPFFYSIAGSLAFILLYSLIDLVLLHFHANIMIFF